MEAESPKTDAVVKIADAKVFDLLDTVAVVYFASRFSRLWEGGEEAFHDPCVDP